MAGEDEEVLVQTIAKYAIKAEGDSDDLEAELAALRKALCIAEVERSGRLLTANENFLRSIGYPLGEIQGQYFSQILDDSEKEQEEFSHLWKRLLSGLFEGGEYKFKHRDGKALWLQGSYIPVSSKEGAITKVIFYASDITKSKKERDAAEAFIQRCKAVETAVNAHSLISFANIHGKIIYANDLFCATSKYSREELIGKDHALLNSGYHPKGFFAEMYRTVAKGQIWRAEVRNRAKDNSHYWVATTILPIFDAEGKMCQYVSIRMDITEQKLKNIDFAGQLAAISRSQTSLEMDMDGTILNANANFLEVMGYSLEEIVGRHHSIFVESSYRKSESYRAFWEKLNLGMFEAAEYKRIAKNGREVWIQAAYNPILDLNGKPKKIVEYATDITIQKKNIEESKNSMVKALEDLNAQNRIRASIEEMTNATRGELTASELGNNVLSCFAKIVGSNVGAFYQMVNNRLELIASYAFKKRKSLSNVFEIGEGIIGQCAREKTAIIISEIPDDYVKVSSGLGESSPGALIAMPVMFEKSLLGALELGKMGAFSDEEIKIIETCAENIGVTLNSAKAREQMRKLLDESKRQATELQQQQAELKSTNEELAAQQLALSESNAALEVQAERLRKSEADIIKKNEELKKNTLYLEQQTREIEEKSRLVEEAKKAVEIKVKELEVSSKYKSEFLANMSHELRTPLNSLLILSKLLASNEEGNLTPDQIESAKIIHRGGSDLLALINDILDLSKVEAGKLEVHLEKVTCRSIVENVIKQFDPIAKDKGLKFITEIALADKTTLHTDTQRAEQVLKNFLSNAFKFTPEGSVTLRIHHPDKKVQFHNSNLNTNNCMGISVIDTGIGISKNKQKVIFEAFQQGDGRTSRIYGGTGLGLSISQELAKILGCEIQMTSAEGEGSTFTLYIPLSAAAPSPQRPDNHEERVVKPQKLSSAEGKTLLIVEDDASFASVLKEIAQKRGYHCLMATTGTEAIKLAQTHQPEAITLDMGLPDIPGEEVIERLKGSNMTSNIPIHIISAGEGVMPHKKGAIGCLKKSNNLRELESVFTQLQDAAEGTIKKILVVEDDAVGSQAIVKLLQTKGLAYVVEGYGQLVLQRLREEKFDCIILDLNLPDLTGFELLEKLNGEQKLKLPPIIVYTGQELSKEEFQRLSKYTPSVIVKGPCSSERLLDELQLFLHSVETKITSPTPQVPEEACEKAKMLHNKKVLLVDDDMRNTFALTAVLRRKGLHVTMAENGEKALEKLESGLPIDIVIMDIMMPVMDGYEATNRIRMSKRDFSDVPIIALTAKVLPEDKARALECGANDFLTKPVDLDRLLNLMGIWLYNNHARQR